MEGVLTDDIMKNWGPQTHRDSDILIYSLGSLDEGHGYALSRQNDDFVAIRTATRVSERTGFTYRGHLPFSSDRVGEIAKDWCPAWMEPEKVTQGIINYLKKDISDWHKDISNAVIISGHGGNNFLKDEEKRLLDSIGVPTLYIIVYDEVKVTHKDYGEIEVGHANHGEHSVAAYMDLLNKKNLNTINEVAKKDPKKALENWKPLSGLGWYVLFGGPRYEPLRKPEYGLVEQAEKFMKEKRIIADVDLGRELFNKNLENTVKQITDFTY
jgi:creatinine amidohydrolase/Fe(II)-dependent formamide hydrolase-like protein